MGVYFFFFFFSFFFLVYVKLFISLTQILFFVIISILGEIIMFFFEIFAMGVDGKKDYFTEVWNSIDLFTLPIYVAFCWI